MKRWARRALRARRPSDYHGAMLGDLQRWYESIWALRDERLYGQFFGSAGPVVYTLDPSTFASLGAADVDPRFLTHGVFECPPTPGRGYWLYVSTGMSNPWGDTPATANAAGESGLGLEFTLHVRQRAAWPIKLLHWLMAVQILVATGELEGEFLQRHDRVELGGALARTDGLITHVLMTSPQEPGMADNRLPDEPEYPAHFSLPTGRVEFLLVLGITGREAAFAASQGVPGLVTLLRHRGIFPFTDPGRMSVG